MSNLFVQVNNKIAHLIPDFKYTDSNNITRYGSNFILESNENPYGYYVYFWFDRTFGVDICKLYTGTSTVLVSSTDDKYICGDHTIITLDELVLGGDSFDTYDVTPVTATFQFNNGIYTKVSLEASESFVSSKFPYKAKVPVYSNAKWCLIGVQYENGNTNEAYTSSSAYVECLPSFNQNLIGRIQV